VREERRLHVHQVEALTGEEQVEPLERAPAHRTVLRIERHRARRDAHGVRIVVVVRSGVGRRDQRGLVAAPAELAAEGLDGGGDAVDARETDVRDVEDPHPCSGHSRHRTCVV
jgi:hypothetical protein